MPSEEREQQLPAHASPVLRPIQTSPSSEIRSTKDHGRANSGHAGARQLAYDFSTLRTPSAELEQEGRVADAAVAVEEGDEQHGPNYSRQPHAYQLDDADSRPPPPSLLSPAFTPPSTPGTTTPSISVGGGAGVPGGIPGGRGVLQHKAPKSIPVDTAALGATAAPRLLEKLPVVNCVVRARIPTTINSSGQEMFLHLYQNNIDNKEHLAIVFGNKIRSRSLDAPRPGESEMDRMIRGAYTGRLYPGRTHSLAVAGGSSSAATSNSRPTNSEESPETPRASAGEIHEGAYKTGPADATPPLVRIHSECYTGETVWSARCDCGEQLDEAARLMSLSGPVPALPIPSSDNEPNSPASLQQQQQPPASGLLSSRFEGGGGGVIIYLRQEGRGIGLSEKLKAYNLQDLGSDTVEANLLLRHPADARSYGLATAMLLDLGLGGDTGIRLLTNNPDKVRAVEGPNREIRVRERVEMVPLSWRTGGVHGINSQEVGAYLRTKIERMGHMLQMNSG